eukprot:8581118-Heterocapsa_arctica.AAC.1
MTEESAVGSHESNGVVERAAQEVGGQVRTIKCATEQAYNIVLDSKSPIIPWLVIFSGSLLCRLRVGVDGTTPYERVKGKPWRRELP